jgi:preprotein translocase, secG subunit
MEVYPMHIIDWFILVISLFLIVIVMMQNSKDDINDAFSGSKTDLFKNQKSRGIDLVLERATLVLSVVFFVLIIVATCIYM